jgi:hypothetical protein
MRRPARLDFDLCRAQHVARRVETHGDILDVDLFAKMRWAGSRRRDRCA